MGSMQLAGGCGLLFSVNALLCVMCTPAAQESCRSALRGARGHHMARVIEEAQVFGLSCLQ